MQGQTLLMMMERRWRTVEEGTFRIDIAALSTTQQTMISDQPRVQIDELNKTLGSHSSSFLYNAYLYYRYSLCPYEIFICSVVIQAGSYQYFQGTIITKRQDPSLAGARGGVGGANPKIWREERKLLPLVAC